MACQAFPMDRPGGVDTWLLLLFSTVFVTLQVPFLCRLRRQVRKREGSEDTSRSGRGTQSHRRELKRVLSPKWLLIMPVLLASPSLSLASQASNTPGCRDGAAGDAPCRETAASGADTPGSARRCSCPEAAGRRDRH